MAGETYTLPYLEFHITDHCNLNCKSCTHFAPLAKESYLSVGSFIKDMKRLNELFSNIPRMRIMGGEPLLHPQVNDFLEISRSFFPNSKITLVTNGILLPFMDLSFYTALKMNNISLDITLYPVLKDDMPLKVLLALKYDIPIEYQNVEYFCRFINVTGDSDRNEIHSKCWINYCTFLREGKIYPCCIPALAYLPNKAFGWKIPGNGFIDIHTACSASKILEFLSRPVSACAYCAKPLWSPWELSNHQPDEWTV